MSSNSSVIRRPSITTEELTPIVLSQLQTASKQKEEYRRQRQQQRPSGGGRARDSGSESCGEEARLKTAHDFISGIQSAISADQRNPSAEASLDAQSGLSKELVNEVDDVLSKLISSIPNQGDPKLVPLITNLQASLKATVDKSHPASLSSVETLDASPRLKSVVENEEDHHAASKIPWKIRAARKRQMKHHTTGMTKDEFAQIKQSLQESAEKCNIEIQYISYPLRLPLNLSVTILQFRRIP